MSSRAFLEQAQQHFPATVGARNFPAAAVGVVHFPAAGAQNVPFTGVHKTLTVPTLI